MTSSAHFGMVGLSKQNSDCLSSSFAQELNENSLNEDQKPDKSPLSWTNISYSSLEESKAPHSDTDSEIDILFKDNVEVKLHPTKNFLNTKITGKALEINGKTPQEVPLNLLSLSAIKKVIIDSTEFSFIEGQIRQLALILKSLENVRKVKLIIRNQKEASTIQKQLDEIFSELQDLKSVKFDFYRSGVASECVEHLSREIITKLKKGLKSFHINLYDSNITNENVQKLAWSLREKFAGLENFKCNLGQTKVTEKVIIQLFHEMPKMKHFELNIGNCAWTDYGMKIFIRNTLKSMKALESFTFLLEATDMMSAQIIELFKNLPETLKELRLDLRWTRTTSESLKVFMKEKLLKLTALEEVELKVDCTLASKKMKEEIDGVNRRFAKKIDVEECLRYQQMIKERYSK